MPRIPDAELNRWKTSADLLALMKQDGMAFTKSGKDWVCACPFHDDAHPSLRVTPKGRSGKALDLWNCPACHTGGDAVQWLVKFRKLSFHAALEVIMAQVGGVAVPGGGAGVVSSVGLPCPLSPDMDKAQMLAAVLDYYHLRLLHEETGLAGRAYLASRGLDDPALMAFFRLGVADRSLGLRLPSGDTKVGGLIRAKLAELGLYRPATMREHLRGCVVLPMKDAVSGDPVKAYGRVLGRRLPDQPKHMYLSGSHAGVLNPAAYAWAASVGHLVLCESPLDALTLWTNGIKNCCSAWGTQGFTGDHLAALRAAGVREVRIAFDRDESGDKGAQMVAEALKAEGIAAYRVALPMGLDVNAYAMTFSDKQERAEALKQVIRCAGGTLGTRDTSPAPEPKAQVALAVPAAAIPLSAAPSPAAAPARGWALTHKPDCSEVLAVFDHERAYRVRGLDKNTGAERLKVSVKVWRQSCPEIMHADALDLSQARPRAAFIAETAKEIGESDAIVKADIARLFGELEALRDEMIAKREAPKAQVATVDSMPADERAAALALLQSPDLLSRIVSDFAACGMVGEETNKLVGYLAATSRLLSRPLAIVVQSSSAAGKSSLLDAVLAMMPDEAQVRYSAMTGQSLYYMGGDSLKHKILAIAEEEGAEQASYSLKLLQSEGKLAIATPSKDAQGQIKTERYEVEGPCSIFLTTTAADVDEELLNRCLVLTVDEDREQTQRIHEQQRKAHTLSGLRAQVDKSRLLRLHQNAQRLLSSIRVVNPFAEKLTFLAGKTRTRRDQPKYLDLIATITLLHQHQRDAKEHVCVQTGEIHPYIEATREDIAAANKLMGEVLGRSLDELPPQTRRLLGLIEGMVSASCASRGVKRVECVFTRREVREWAGWGNTQIKTHMMRLEEMEYVAVRKRGPLMLYELVYDGGTGKDGGGKFFPGLMDPENLVYEAERSGLEGAKSAPGRPQVGGVSGVGRSEEKPSKQSENRQNNPEGANMNKKGVDACSTVAGGVIDQSKNPDRQGGGVLQGKAQVKDPRARSFEAAELAADGRATEEKNSGAIAPESGVA